MFKYVYTLIEDWIIFHDEPNRLFILQGLTKKDFSRLPV